MDMAARYLRAAFKALDDHILNGGPPVNDDTIRDIDPELCRLADALRDSETDWDEDDAGGNSVSDRITFRLGPLAGPLAAYCEQHGTTPSEAIRLALSRLMRVEAPEMTPGNPDIGEQAEAGAAARWKKRRGRK